MKSAISQEQISNTAVRLGIPDVPFTHRRIARAFDLVETNKVNEVSHDDGFYRVHSQYDDKIYTIELDHGNPAVTRLAKGKACAPHCTCPDNERTIFCKHSIASMMMAFENEQRGAIFACDRTRRQSRKPSAQKASALAIARALTVKETPNPKVKASWVVTDGTVYTNVWQDLNGKICCVCGAYYKRDCIHKQAIRDYHDAGNGWRVRRDDKPSRHALGSKMTSAVLSHASREKPSARECGTSEAKALQDEMNGSNGKVEHTGVAKRGRLRRLSVDSTAPGEPCDSSESHPSTRVRSHAPDHQLDRSDPFQESELLDVEQIEGRSNGDWVHKLSNGEYIISYHGIMALAEQHGVTFTKHTDEQEAKDTRTVIAHARCGNNTRASGKPMNGSFITAIELAKRNAARQLLPLPEIKALEHKAKLEAEFNWQVAKRKCFEIVPDFMFDILLTDLVRDGKLEQKHSSDYNRKEWLLIFDACRKDAETNGNDDNDNGGGDNTPSSPDKFTECKAVAKHDIRYSWLKSDMLKEGVVSDTWTGACDRTRDDIAKLKQACEIDASLFGKELGHWTVEIQPNKGKWAYQRRWSFWLLPMTKRCFWCGKSRDEGILPDTFIKWGRYEIKASLCLECSRGEHPNGEELTQKFDQLYHGNDGKNTVVTSESVYGGRKVKFEINTNKPSWVTIHYDNGSHSTSYSETIYESVLGSA